MDVDCRRKRRREQMIESIGGVIMRGKCIADHYSFLGDGLRTGHRKRRKGCFLSAHTERRTEMEERGRLKEEKQYLRGGGREEEEKREEEGGRKGKERKGEEQR